MKQICDLCGTRHESYQAHVFATNRIATNTSATNAEKAPEVSLADAPSEEVRGRVDLVSRPVAVKTKNRRDRAAYNAYQREYMRKRRGK